MTDVTCEGHDSRPPPGTSRQAFASDQGYHTPLVRPTVPRVSALSQTQRVLVSLCCAHSACWAHTAST